MAKDPICGMFVEEKPDTIRHITEGREYYFCSKQCLDEFSAPEKELKKLKKQVIISIALTIPVSILTYLMMLFPSTTITTLYHGIINYVIFALATPVQFWIGWRFYRGLWDSIKAKACNMDALIAIGKSAAYFYSAIVTILPGYFPFESVYFDTSTIIITLILIAGLLESRTMRKLLWL
jgi:cation transport ATPase